MHTDIRTRAFYVKPGDPFDAHHIAAALITRGVWFTVDPYPDGVTRFDVKPEAARLLWDLRVSEVAP